MDTASNCANRLCAGRLALCELLPDLEKLDFRPFKQGGARIGAGPRPSGRKAVLLRLSPKLISALRKDAERNHKTLSDVAEERLAHA